MALLLWAKHARISNMNTERLLALVRRSSPLRCVLERLIGCGYLSQIQSKHLAAGGSDIRKVTRSDLLDRGVPLRCAQGRSARAKALRRSDGAGSKTRNKLSEKTRWMNQRSTSTSRRSRLEYKALMSKLSEEYDERLKSGRVEFLAEPPAQSVAVAKPYSERIGQALLGCSDKSSPLKVSLMTDAAKKIIGHTSSDMSMGLTETLEPLRNAFIDECFVADAQQVPARSVLPLNGHIPCGHKHPDVCAAACKKSAKEANEYFGTHAVKLLTGAMIQMDIVFADGTEKKLYWVKAFSEGKHEVVLVKCSLGFQALWLNPHAVTGLEYEVSLCSFNSIWRIGEPHSIVVHALSREWNATGCSIEDMANMSPISLSELKKGDSFHIWPKSAALECLPLADCTETASGDTKIMKQMLAVFDRTTRKDILQVRNMLHIREFMLFGLWICV